MNEINFKIPKGWRKGQFIFNFLEFMKSKGVHANQNRRMADPFHLDDKTFDELYKEFLEKI